MMAFERFVFLAVSAGCVTIAVGQNTPSPAPASENPRFGFNQTVTIADQMLSRADRNADHQLTKNEFTSLADAWFEILDTDNTGRVSQEEFSERFGNVLPPPGTGQRGGGPPGGGRGFGTSR